ncbi:hypothetical protein D6Z83_22560, partial [Pseudoroseomonas wenyumeiae]
MQLGSVSGAKRAQSQPLGAKGSKVGLGHQDSLGDPATAEAAAGEDGLNGATSRASWAPRHRRRPPSPAAPGRQPPAQPKRPRPEPARGPVPAQPRPRRAQAR